MIRASLFILPPDSQKNKIVDSPTHPDPGFNSRSVPYPVLVLDLRFSGGRVEYSGGEFSAGSGVQKVHLAI